MKFNSLYNLDKTIKRSIVNNDYESISFILDSQGASLEELYVKCAKYGNEEMLSSLRGCGAKSHNEAMVIASLKGNFDIVTSLEKGLVIHKGKQYDPTECYSFIDYAPILYASLKSESVPLIDWLLTKPIPNVKFEILMGILQSCKNIHFKEYVVSILPDELEGLYIPEQLPETLDQKAEYELSDELANYIRSGNLREAHAELVQSPADDDKIINCLKLSLSNGKLPLSEYFLEKLSEDKWMRVKYEIASEAIAEAIKNRIKNLYAVIVWLKNKNCDVSSLLKDMVLPTYL